MNDDNKHLREEFDMFREFATAQLTVKSNTAEVRPNEPAPEPKPAPVPPKEEIDIDARIAKALEEKDEEKRLKANLSLAEEVMVKHFGSKSDASKAVEARASELGISAEWLASLAFQSPRAFFVTMNVNPDETPQSTSTPSVGSDVNARRLSEANPGVKPGSYKYYQELRRKDPSKFYSSAVQIAFMADAQRMGSDFYN
jgi:hypothetical protein